MKWLVVLLSLTTTASGAVGEPGVGGEEFSLSCWVGGLSFSPGATVRAGAGVMICSESGWSASDADASGCIKAGNFHSVGDEANVPNNDGLVVICQKDGTWKERS